MDIKREKWHYHALFPVLQSLPFLIVTPYHCSDSLFVFLTLLCISPAEAESLHTRVRPQPALLHDEFVLDTNIVSYILDGELWAREPATLMRARPEMIVAYGQAGENLEAMDKLYKSLSLSKLTYQCCLTKHPRLSPPLSTLNWCKPHKWVHRISMKS